MSPDTLFFPKKLSCGKFLLMNINLCRRQRDWGTSGIVAFLLVLFQSLLWPVTMTLPSGLTPLRQPPRDSKEQKKAQHPPIGSLDGLKRVTHRIRRGDTLEKLFKPFGLSREGKQTWFRSIRKHYSPKRLRTGKEIYFFFSKPRTTDLRPWLWGADLTGRSDHSSPRLRTGRSVVRGKNSSIRPWENKPRHLKVLELDLNKDWILTWERGNQGIVFRKRERPYQTEVRTIGGTITDSVYWNGVRLGLHPTVISQFVDIFGWDVNFQTDVRSGDYFKVLYKRKFRKGSKKTESFRILAAALINQGQKHFAVYFQKENGEDNYYDLEGRSLARTFLRYPVEYSRISSTFVHARFHPILKIKRPHHGVDFAAKPGTLVRAVGNGRVTYAGWKKGGYGRFIEIQHGSVFRSHYAHLRGFAREIQRGTNVRKGQIIGYVGCTGLCTGPHLHFELYKNRLVVNPLKIELPPGDEIEPALRNDFEKTKRLFLTELADRSRS